MSIEGYGRDDIVKVLQRTYKETEENRDRALKLYDHMENAMVANKGDLVVLSQMADRYLEQASRQTEILVRLAGVMQKLKQYAGDDGGKLMTDVNSLLEQLDKNKVTPFTIGQKKPQVIQLPPTPPTYIGDPLPGQEPTTGDPSPDQRPTNTSGDDIQLEADL
jgi:hypothetical protein